MSNLKNKLAKIQEALKDIEGVQLHDIRNFCDGNLSVNKKGVLKLPIALPAQEVMQTPDDLRCVMEGRWKIVPILMFVEE